MVETDFGTEDPEAAVHKLWISGPKALSTESKCGRRTGENAGEIWVVPRAPAVRDWRTEAREGTFCGSEPSEANLDKGL